MPKATTLGLLAMFMLAACAQSDEGEEAVPADTATMAPAPMPMPMDSTMMMDSAAHDTMQMNMTTR